MMTTQITAALVDSARTAVKTGCHAIINVKLPDGTTGTAHARAILAAARGARTWIPVAQGTRVDEWQLCQLAVA